MNESKSKEIRLEKRKKHAQKGKRIIIKKKKKREDVQQWAL